jgi:hypothetical protein
MLRAAWLTLKIHRFEIVFATVLTAVLAVSAWVSADQLRGVPTPACPDFNEMARQRCEDVQMRYFGASDQAGMVMVALAFVAPVIGLSLGVPLVGRELELRTILLAWGLQGRRWRWLLDRLVPIVLVGLVVLAALGMATTALFDAQNVLYGAPHTLDDLGNHGLPLVGRGLMALGLGLLAGAVSGRTLPAFLAGGVVMVAWFGWGAPALRDAQVEDKYVWMTYDDRDRNDLDGLAYDTPGNENWYRAPDGSFVSETQAYLDACGVEIRYVDGEASYELTPAQNSCLNDVMDAADATGYQLATRLVPGSHYGEFQFVETAATLLIGAAAILATFVAVERRKRA